MTRRNWGIGICPICAQNFTKLNETHKYCCKHCRWKAAWGKERCKPIRILSPEKQERRRAQDLLRHRKQNIKLKIDILTYYGHGKLSCVMCGESRIDCLSIDHINNNGYEERKKNKHYGRKIYKDLKRDGFPLGYQTLCMNCQFIKMHEIHRLRIKKAQTLLSLTERVVSNKGSGKEEGD